MRLRTALLGEGVVGGWKTLNVKKKQTGGGCQMNYNISTMTHEHGGGKRLCRRIWQLWTFKAIGSFLEI